MTEYCLPQWIYAKQINLIQNVCKAGLIPENEIDSLIETAIQAAQITGNYEIQILLTEYKHQHFPYSNPADKLRLE